MKYLHNVFSFLDGVAGQLKKIIESVFAATKQIRKGSPLKKVIIVVDQPLRSAACKIVEGKHSRIF